MSGVPEPAAEQLRAFFGPAWPGIEVFETLLRGEAQTRGLIGPRELPRLWSRHVVNSAALAAYLPTRGSVADIGSGAGFPGVVLALMRPDLSFHLVEPMQRRVAWLEEVRDRLGLQNVTVVQASAQDLRRRLVVDVVTARAVADLGRLTAMCLPILRRGGRLVVLKGRRAADEVADAADALRRSNARVVGIHEVDVLGLGEPTTVVEIVRT